MTKFLQEVRATNEASWVVSWLNETIPGWRRPPSLISKKIPITPNWIKISAPNFMERCITAMQRWPRDHKSKLEVNTRDVIKWRFWSICASISVTITDISTKFDTEHKYHTANTSEWPNSHKLKIQDCGGRYLEFWKYLGFSVYVNLTIQACW